MVELVVNEWKSEHTKRVIESRYKLLPVTNIKQ